MKSDTEEGIPQFHIATPREIREGKTTDIYFVRTHEIIEEKGLDRPVKAEFIAKGFHDDWPWAVFSGLEEILVLLEGLPLTVRALPEGTVFRSYEPVMEIEGNYQDFCLLETAILGLMCQASGVATKAARCKKAAGDRPVLSFGARRVHPALTPMVDRNAYIGGCDGISAIKSAEILGIEPTGTMPHALILLIGDTVEAALAFDEVVDPKVGRVVLIDTFNDEKFEAIRLAEALKEKLYAIRLDTPSSRRGNFPRMIEEIRWELDIRGFSHVKIFVSGGMNENKILQLNPYVDAYGVGTAISNAPVVDFSMDIIEIEGKPFAKKGKMSGSKQLYRCVKCFRDQVVFESRGIEDLSCDCGGALEPLLRPVLIQGKVEIPVSPPQEIREYVLSQLEHFDL
ncbi:MAG: nicotinate phosphoribosyltransferase [Deltaproteobacteria bacterium]|nr:MAG: nicotinate phosphoribosyltransferase [Deltaproteobacteria bacterium]